MKNSWKALTFCACILAVFVAMPVAAQIIVANPAPTPLPIRPQLVPPELRHSGLQILSPATLRCGTQTVTFSVTETNGGSSAGTHFNDLTYDFGSGTTFWPVCRISRPSFPALSTRVWTATCTFWNGPCDCLPTSYTATFRTFIDSLNGIVESNENNNLSNQVSIPATCP